MAATITSKSNPLIKRVRALRRRKERSRSGAFLVEGLHHVGAALEAGWELEHLLYAPDLVKGDFAYSLLETARGSGLDPQPVSAPVMDSLTEKDNPQGVVGVARQRSTGPGTLENFRRGAALLSPQDPGNLGTILRTLDAVGGEALFQLDGGVDPYHPGCVRASMGAIFYKPVIQLGFGEFLGWVKQNGVRLIGTSAHASQPYTQVRGVDPPWILLLGSEQKGLSREQMESCQTSIALPMHGRGSSLNLAVAAGVLLYALIEGEGKGSE